MCKSDDGVLVAADDNDKKVKSGRELLGVFEESLEDRANCFSSWTLSFLNPLLMLGSQKLLDAEDIGVPSKQDSAERAYQCVQKAWEEEVIKCDAYNANLIAKHEKQEKENKDKNNNDKNVAVPVAIEEKIGIEGEGKNNNNNKEKKSKLKLKEPSISASLVASFGKMQLFLAMVYYVTSSLLGFVPVLILNDLVRYFEHYHNNQLLLDEAALMEETILVEEFKGMANPWVEVVLLGLVPFIMSTLQTRSQSTFVHCGVFVRTAASTMLYRKSLNVSAAGRAKTSTGQVVNMMSNDTMQLQRFLQFVGFTSVAPLQIIISLYLIYLQVGNAMWVGVAYMVLLAPVNTWMFGIVANLRREVLKYSDKRVKIMNEILTGIRIIKFYAWEKPFGKEVGRLREKEMNALTKLAYVTAVGFSVLLLSTPIIQPIFVFITYVNIQDEPLTAATAFTTVALFNIMRFPFAFMPMGLLQYIQSKISLKRLERYLALPELKKYILNTPHPEHDKDDDTFTKSASITIKDGHFGWFDPDAPEVKPIQDEKPKKKPKKKKKGKLGDDSSDDSSMDSSERSSITTYSTYSNESGRSGAGGGITLQDINCTIEAGSLVAVVGSVGSGKSSFLSAILGEMESIKDSKIYIPRDDHEKDSTSFVSYCAQSPWVINETIKGNILFNRPYDEDRYNAVLDCCALLDDLKVLPAGDATEIGERGINLSGGQKARVSLARAMYDKETKVMLLDDPLSAVDGHVGEHLFKKAISGEINHGKTRILVTHHVHVLAKCDKVIVFDHGRIKAQGTYQELIDSGVDFAGAIDVSKIQKDDEEEESDDKDTKAKVGKGGEKEGSSSKKKHKKGKKSSKDRAAAKDKLKKAGESLVTEEERGKGAIAGHAYMHYARAGGLFCVFCVFTITALGRASEILTSFFLAAWAEKMTESAIIGEPFTDSQSLYYISIYALLGFLGVLGLGGRASAIAFHRMKASKILHDELSDSVLRAPVAFFDVTPIGRVLNRFAADMDKIDLELTSTISQGINVTFSIIGAYGAIVIATKGTFLIPMVPLGILYYMVQKWYRKTSTELQRVTSVANSPIFADFSQTLSGTSTIRAYGVQGSFFDNTKSSFDNMNASYILVQLCEYWLALRLDVMGGFISFFVGVVAVGTLPYDFIPAGWLGLALTYAIEVTTYLKFGVQMIARLEADMSSVERILYYAENIEPEADAFVPEKDPEEGTWPTKGEITLSHASMRYREGPLVLKDLSFTVRPGEKLGVCGRTGSGKSSLMIALFRIAELENMSMTGEAGDKEGEMVEGKLLIDGVNTKEIGTATLRMNLSIIPQEPVMFSNTVRYNLDPFCTATNEELWEVITKVRLNELILSLPKQLDEEVAEGGENFSQGQRQLLCIARSLLRKPKILVMDEATASIDNETDAAIQEMIRDNFRNATVLTIAHRLNTIMDSDRILVLDDGRIAELDTPANLLAKEGGHFKSMVEKSHQNENEHKNSNDADGDNDNKNESAE